VEVGNHVAPVGWRGGQPLVIPHASLANGEAGRARLLHGRPAAGGGRVLQPHQGNAQAVRQELALGHHLDDGG